MNKILKKITSSALAAVISLSAAANVFAGSIGIDTVSNNKIYMVTNSYGTTFPVDYQAKGKVEVKTYNNYFTVNASTSIKANETSFTKLYNLCWLASP